MNLNQVTVPARDITASVAFYTLLGLELIVFDTHYARFTCLDGGATFSLDLHEDYQPAPGGPVIYFEVAELDEKVGILQAAGVVFTQQPRDEPHDFMAALLAERRDAAIELCLESSFRLLRHAPVFWPNSEFAPHPGLAAPPPAGVVIAGAASKRILCNIGFVFSWLLAAGDWRFASPSTTVSN